ncbi:MAG: penicillin acylase family protein [Candidatus Promineifilaceae bacterium]|nr:penicillin acylase family protein [Candidatus Promineifilaceae bacterium]
MSRLGRIVLSVATVLLVAIVVLVVIVAVKIRQPLPEISGTVLVNGVQEPIEILRDDYGIPHIYAQSTEDMFFGQGYVHAQDRFWQMEWWRHQAQGRLSEIVGEATLDIDRFLRNVGFNRIAESHLAYYEANEPQYVAYLEAYADGVNAYIEQNPQALSVNFTILGLVGEPWEIEPWTPVDSLSWGVAMAWDLRGSGSLFAEQERLLLQRELGEATVSEILPFYPYGERPVIAPSKNLINAPIDRDDDLNGDSEEDEALNRVDWKSIVDSFIGSPPASLVVGSGPFVGSNSWAVHGDHTESGLPLLANDTHLSIQMPSIWYEVGLHAPEWNVVGFSFAGVPGVVIGHNEHIAWGFTNIGPDVQDLYIEKLNPNNSLQYEFKGEWRDVEVLEEVIEVNGGEDVVLEVRQTHHGPILNEVDDNIRDVLALRWTAFEPSHTFLAIVQLNQARNFEEFREAASNFDVPTQNMLYADVEGNIGYQTPGLVPIRPTSDGLTPVPGWTGEHEWQGWIPFEDLPTVLNPPEGYIVTANNAVHDREYPYQISLYWAPGDRAQRIVDLLTESVAAGPVTVEDMARIQFDNYSFLAASYVPLLEGLNSDDEQIQAALERLRGWDFQEEADSVPAALFEIFFMHLIQRTMSDDIGANNVNEFRSAVFYHDLAEQADARWWDDQTTEQVETREEIIMLALADTISWFEERHGSRMNDWTWGRVHTATFVSQPLGQSGVGPIEALVNRGPFPSSGGTSIVNAASWDWNQPAAVGSIASERMIVDLSRLDESRAIHPTGQSGHPTSPHYDDMIPLWLAGEYHPMHFSRSAVDTAVEETLILQPAASP